MSANDLYLTHEQRELESELKKKKYERDSDTSKMVKILILIGFIVCLTYANAEPIECKRFWGDTWICPNPDCRYENYDAVDYCGICGTRRK
jgi:hypothetical protein